MSLLKFLFGIEKKEELTEELMIESGVCPNCWGNQAYDDQYVEFVEDQTKANINHDKSNQKAFVAQFVETHLTGIRLKKEGEQLACPACSGKYKTVSEKAN